VFWLIFYIHIYIMIVVFDRIYRYLWTELPVVSAHGKYTKWENHNIGHISRVTDIHNHDLSRVCRWERNRFIWRHVKFFWTATGTYNIFAVKPLGATYKNILYTRTPVVNYSKIWYVIFELLSCPGSEQSAPSWVFTV